MSNARTRVAVVYGGRSGEHDVSCESAASILTHLDRRRYDVVAVRISVDGCWTISGPDFPTRARPTETNRLRSIWGTLERLRDVDIVLPALHGRYGKDGTIQSLLEMAGLRYVGNGALASAAGMDREYAKKLLTAAGLAVADGVVLRADRSSLTTKEKERLGLPVFVRPARAGSSLGVSRVDTWDELASAIRAARQSDPKVLVEKDVRGREIDIGVLEMPDGAVHVSPPLEIMVANNRPGFDFDAKYDDLATLVDIPARVDRQTRARLDRAARQAFAALDCAGLLRIGCFLEADGRVVVNEVNTFPGFTSASQYPRMWQAAGLDYPELLDTLIQTALCRTPDRPHGHQLGGLE